jgi:hypothetical protein
MNANEIENKMSALERKLDRKYDEQKFQKHIAYGVTWGRRINQPGLPKRDVAIVRAVALSEVEALQDEINAIYAELIALEAELTALEKAPAQATATIYDYTGDSIPCGGFGAHANWDSNNIRNEKLGITRVCDHCQKAMGDNPGALVQWEWKTDRLFPHSVQIEGSEMKLVGPECLKNWIKTAEEREAFVKVEVIA